MERLNKIREIMKENFLDAFLINSPYNKFYLANLYSNSGYLLITRNNQYALVDSRYYVQVKENAKEFSVIEISKERTIFNLLNEIAKKESIKIIGFEGDNLTYDNYMKLAEHVKVVFLSISLDSLRVIKTSEEIEKIRTAAQIADKAYKHILSFVKEGMTEKQVERELVRYIKECNGDKESFDIIVASGERGALPHGKASDKVIKRGEFITIDFGVNYNNYCSDMTRTFLLGEAYNKEMIKIYEIVKKAQWKAVKSVKAGITASYLDGIARNIIEKEGYGKNFGHNLGHGVGILVHEYPVIGKGNDIFLEAGMIITIEPGIYIEGLGGVRIEDDILVTEEGFEVLTNSDRELISVKG
ncbi:M24 family metallopeptidase [Caloramator sp. E03]|uniref:M24 family metallopeptidase n=1 Tax=Caloramator sp. E03 TaxID=2576307 RepID=UPI001110538B|nr:M24 family metallopeptidase [Caloramator sp. E03]QCX32862.1 M24 family metallopeptidase [Caloramator sp. E03]